MAPRSFRLRSVLVAGWLLAGCGESVAPVAPIGGDDSQDAGVDGGAPATMDAGGDDLPGSTTGDGTEDGSGGGGDGAGGDGATGDGATGDGATGDGATGDGATGDGSSGDGSTGDGSTDPGCGGVDGPTTVSSPNCEDLVTLTGTVYDFKDRTTKLGGGTVASSECGTSVTSNASTGAFTIQVPRSAAFYLRLTPKASDTTHAATLTGYLNLDAANDTPLKVYMVPTSAVTASRAVCSVEPLVLFGGVRNLGDLEPEAAFSALSPESASVAYLTANLTRDAAASSIDSTGYALYEGLGSGPNNLYFDVNDPVACFRVVGDSAEISLFSGFVPFERGHVTAQLIYYNCP